MSTNDNATGWDAWADTFAAAAATPHVPLPPRIDTLLATIARQELGIETIETRNSDSLDFHNINVASLRVALRAAYDLGRTDAINAA